MTFEECGTSAVTCKAVVQLDVRGPEPQPKARTSWSRFVPHQDCVTMSEYQLEETLSATIAIAAGSCAKAVIKAATLLMVTTLKQ